MKTYTAKLDHGQGGTKSITAADAQTALVEAERWARDGEWKSETDVLVEIFEGDQPHTMPAAESIIGVGRKN